MWVKGSVAHQRVLCTGHDGEGTRGAHRGVKERGLLLSVGDEDLARQPRCLQK